MNDAQIGDKATQSTVSEGEGAGGWVIIHSGNVVLEASVEWVPAAWELQLEAVPTCSPHPAFLP